MAWAQLDLHRKIICGMSDVLQMKTCIRLTPMQVVEVDVSVEVMTQKKNKQCNCISRYLTVRWWS